MEVCKKWTIFYFIYFIVLYFKSIFLQKYVQIIWSPTILPQWLFSNSVEERTFVALWSCHIRSRLARYTDIIIYLLWQPLTHMCSHLMYSYRLTQSVALSPCSKFRALTPMPFHVQKIDSTNYKLIRLKVPFVFPI